MLSSPRDVRRTQPFLFLTLLSAVLTCLMTPSAAVASDRDVETQLKQAYARAGWSEVRVSVDDGVVTLKGEVPHVWAMQEIERQARGAADVMRVVNEVSVTRITDDAALARAVEEELKRCAPVTMFEESSVVVLGGTAVLLGYLTAPDTLSSLLDAAAQVPGIRGVMSQIEILPDSDADRQVRMAIAAAIGGDPALSKAAAEQPPAVRFIVKNGRVRLIGSVATGEDRARAENVVSGVTGVQGVENKLTVASSTS